jgi:hypothetical protein
MIWWPPESVLELARLAVDSGGDPAAIHRLLDPTVIPVSYKPNNIILYNCLFLNLQNSIFLLLKLNYESTT